MLFIFNTTTNTAIKTLSLHDALPILAKKAMRPVKLMLERDEEHWCAGNRPSQFAKVKARGGCPRTNAPDRKSTRLNSSHVAISYAVFCLKKKNSPTTSSLPSHSHSPC